MYNAKLQNHLALGPYIARIILNGKSSMPPTILKTSSSVNPTILNGNRISQISGNNNSTTNAIGQHITKRIHQRIKPRNVLITKLFFNTVMQSIYQKHDGLSRQYLGILLPDSDKSYNQVNAFAHSAGLTEVLHNVSDAANILDLQQLI